MDIESCYQLGYILKTHGIHGELLVYLDTDNPEEYKLLESVFVEIKQKLVPFFIEQIKVNDNKAIIRFQEIENLEAAEKLKGLALYLPLNFLPELDEGQFYYHEVVGFTVIDEIEGRIGKILNIYEANGNDLFGVDHHGHEVLIPIQNDLIKKIDKMGKEIYMILPDGLLDVYLNP